MMQRSFTTESSARQNSDSRFASSSDHLSSSAFDNIDTTFVSRTDSYSFDGPDFYSRSAVQSNSPLVVPLTPIGCNKSSLSINNNSSNNNLFGKYLMNKKISNLRQLTSARAVSTLAVEETKPVTADSTFLQNDLGSFDNEDDREFFQSINDASSNNNNYYYNNTNGAMSTGSFLDNESMSNENDFYAYENNDVEDLMLNDTLDQIYNDGTPNNDDLNYTINPMITQINPKQFVSSEYDVEDIDMLLQEAEELEQAATFSTNSNAKKNIITSRPVGDYNIFIKGEDGIELPVQEVFKKFNFNLFDPVSSNANIMNTPTKKFASSVSLSPPSAASSNWISKSTVLSAPTNGFANVDSVVNDESDTTQQIDDEPAIASRVTSILKEEKARSSGHSEEYKCEHLNCKKSFSRPYDLVRHTKTIHSKQKKLYRCLICIKELGESEGHKKTFSRGDALSRHIKLKHELKIGDESLRFAMKFAKENVEYVEN
ncbi:hypothetical protein QEN19_004131 [Hanseniaspora menglaensis]